MAGDGASRKTTRPGGPGATNARDNDTGATAERPAGAESGYIAANCLSNFRTTGTSNDSSPVTGYAAARWRHAAPAPPGSDGHRGIVRAPGCAATPVGTAGFRETGLREPEPSRPAAVGAGKAQSLDTRSVYRTGVRSAERSRRGARGGEVRIGVRPRIETRGPTESASFRNAGHDERNSTADFMSELSPQATGLSARRSRPVPPWRPRGAQVRIRIPARNPARRTSARNESSLRPSRTDGFSKSSR